MLDFFKIAEFTETFTKQSSHIVLETLNNELKSTTIKEDFGQHEMEAITKNVRKTYLFSQKFGRKKISCVISPNG